MKPYHFCLSIFAICLLVTLVMMEYSSHVSNNARTLMQIASANTNHAGPMSSHDHQPAVGQPSSGFQPDPSTVMLPSSKAIELPMNMTVSHSKGWAAKEEWTKRKADIQQLYFHEKKTLKEVKRLMEIRHGFKATSVPCAVFPIASI